MRIDTCGTSCPQPVLMTKKELDKNPNSNEIEILTDNNTSKSNVKKFLESKGFNVEIIEENDLFVLRGTK
jgi:tRNA 2-thiouridine synthesizing protein A